MLSASEAWLGTDVQDVKGWMVFFLRVAWEDRNQSTRELSAASGPSLQAAPIVGSRSLARQPPWSFEAQPARRACRWGEQVGQELVVLRFTANDAVAMAAD
jgi:hypothetical protein